MTKQIITALTSLLILSCSVTSSLHRNSSGANISQLSKSQREQQREEYKSQIITREKGDNKFFIAPTDTLDGERVMSLDIEQVTVVSKMRTIPERAGEVTLDFVVSIPKELLGRSRNVIIAPQLHNNEEVEPLEELQIRGVLVDRIQQRDDWQYRTYVSRYAPTEAEAERMYHRLVKYPRPEDARLDSLVESSNNITYYYSQTIKTDETTKRMMVTLAGRVEGVDNTLYHLPPSDTLSYTVSSMLSFLDTAPRYRVKIVDKYITVTDRNYIEFKVGESRIVESLGKNREELGRIKSLMREITEQDEFFIDTITLTATSSPEGAYHLNEMLSKSRANAFKSYLGRDVERLITVRWVAEDWSELRRMIAEDNEIKSRDEIVRIIDTQSDADRREQLIRSRYPSDYAYIRSKIYPLLRGVNFRYNLRRKGMVKDTVQTTELDTLYARGVKLLQQRNYAKALYILNDYRDRNTIIAHLSMGHDEEVLQLVAEQREDATILYLRAIAQARLGMLAEARDSFDKACELEPRMKFRANLDPEITKLLKE